MCNGLQAAPDAENRLKRHDKKIDEFLECLREEDIEVPKGYTLVRVNNVVSARNKKRQQKGEQERRLCNVEMKDLLEMEEDEFIQFRRAEIVDLALNQHIIPAKPSRKRSRTILKELKKRQRTQ